MSLMNNGFSRFLLSGFGTGTAAGKALGITIFICLLGVFVVWWIIKFIIDMVHKNQTGGAPDFKEGPYVVKLDSVGPTPDLLFNELCEINGFRLSLVKKLMDKAPVNIAYGCSKQKADDFVVVLEDKGAKVSISRK